MFFLSSSYLASGGQLRCKAQNQIINIYQDSAALISNGNYQKIRNSYYQNYNCLFTRIFGVGGSQNDSVLTIKKNGLGLLPNINSPESLLVSLLAKAFQEESGNNGNFLFISLEGTTFVKRNDLNWRKLRVSVKFRKVTEPTDYSFLQASTLIEPKDYNYELL
ncbi:hypothetical protein [Coleofasciculus sp.]|uniref:hypothetical protein n=1 Tax=Coleofasciculus sp. TaxID=3100458 RepID=UPI0039F9557C